MLNDISILNIREYLSSNNKNLGEEQLQQVLSDFLCKKNADVQRFLKEQSIDFTKKNQSVTYLVFSDEDAELLGYFTIAIKPISINADKFSNTLKRKIARVSELDCTTGEYTLSAYLIAQLGKNYTNNANKKIAGEQLLQAAINAIKELQYMAGGMVVFLEAEQNEKLMNFYKCENGFKEFSTRETQSKNGDEYQLVQLLKVLQ